MKFFFGKTILSKLSETRVAEVSRRSEPSSRGKRTFEVRRRRAASAGFAAREQPDLAGERKAHLAEHVRNSCGQNDLEDMFHEHREPSLAFKRKRDILK